MTSIDAGYMEYFAFPFPKGSPYVEKVTKL